MKLKTGYDKEWAKWHKVFLWKPTWVKVCNEDYTKKPQQSFDWEQKFKVYRTEKRWLCFVKGKCDYHRVWSYWIKPSK